MDYVVRYNVVYVATCILSAIIQTFGYPGFVFGISIGTLFLFRVFWMAAVYPLVGTFDNLMLCFLVSWLFMLLCQIVVTLVLYIRYRHGHEKKL